MDPNLSIERRMQQIVKRDQLIHRLAIICALLLATIMMLVVLLISHTYAADCLTKAEARAKWPQAHLWWHTAEKCWDNHAGKGRTYGKHERPQEELKPRPAPPARASIIYPPLTNNSAPNNSSLFAHAEVLTVWPLLMDIDEDHLPDCCWPPLETIDANGDPIKKSIGFADRWQPVLDKPLK